MNIYQKFKEFNFFPLIFRREPIILAMFFPPMNLPHPELIEKTRSISHYSIANTTSVNVFSPLFYDVNKSIEICSAFSNVGRDESTIQSQLVF